MIAFLILIALVELLALVVLLGWWRVLEEKQGLIERDRRECYVCITGASVTSFDSHTPMCTHHRAHYTLIATLEKRERDYNEWLELERDIGP